MRIERIKRGQYSITYELITDRPNEEKELAIAERFIRKVEDTIVKQPEYWLWSHKRWRYRPEEFKPGFTE